MDANIVNPFIEGVLNILETTAFVTANPGEVYLKRNFTASGDITGIIRLSGEFNATISVSFSSGAILKIVSNMFGEEMTSINDDIKDAVGEISNMVSGQVTNNIASLGTALKAEMQEVILQPGHTIPHLGKYPTIAVPFKTETGEFTIEFCFAP
jgi:chemotaxis protein CheX